MSSISDRAQKWRDFHQAACSLSQVAGLYDYDVFGGMNRQPLQGDSPHPYPNGENTTIADFTQKAAASGLTVDLRARFHLVDTEGVTGVTDYDYSTLVDGDTGAVLLGSSAGPLGGQHAGAPVSTWVTPSAGHLQVTFHSDGSNFCPNGSGGIVCDSPCPSPYGAYSCPNFPYTGVSLEAADYREHQAGATPLALPLRFPGQYYDPETDLHENWHRFYDPSLGRYLEPEPMWSVGGQGVKEFLRRARETGDPSGPPAAPAILVGNMEYGRTAPVYGYAANNPVSLTDPDGRLSFSGWGNFFTPGPPGPVPDPEAPHNGCSAETTSYCEWFCKNNPSSSPLSCAGDVPSKDECMDNCAFNNGCPSAWDNFIDWLSRPGSPL